MNAWDTRSKNEKEKGPFQPNRHFMNEERKK